MTKYYSQTHEWVKVEGDEAIVGVSSYAAKELGDITYVELPKVSSDVIVGDSVGVVESVKAASDVYSPLSGTVNAVNKNLDDDPGLVSNSPEENGWMYRLENIDLDELEDLMSAEDYAKYLKTL